MVLDKSAVRAKVEQAAVLDGSAVQAKVEQTVVLNGSAVLAALEGPGLLVVPETVPVQRV